MNHLVSGWIARAVLSFSLVAATVSASYGEDKTIRIGFQKYGKLVLLKSKGTLEPKLKALGYSVTWIEFPSGPPLLEAINDRAITWLLVEDRQPAPATMRRETLASARARIRGGFAYSPQGRVVGGDLRIAGNEVTESYVRAVLDPDGLIASMREYSDTRSAGVFTDQAATDPRR